MKNNSLMTSEVLAWLLDSDPAIRWQVMRDLAGSPMDQVLAERVKLTTEGWGATLLALQAADGTWSGIAWNPEWTSTFHALTLLREFGLDPEGQPARQALSRVRQQVTWKESGPEECQENAFFAGEVEPCINGQVLASGAYFGQDVHGLVSRLLSEQLEDGGWNCDAWLGSTRSSFNTTICVLEGFYEYELHFGANYELAAAREKGQDYLLDRHPFRSLSTGDPISHDRKGGPPYSYFAFPNWWHYDVLRALDYLRRTGMKTDPRLDEALDMVRAKQQADGRWLLDVLYPGEALIDFGEQEGQPSRWITLRALRVLKHFAAF